MKQNQIIANKYIMGKKLTNASRSFDARNKNNGQSLVIKIYELQQYSLAEKNELESRLRVVKSMQIPYIVQIIDLVTVGNQLYVVQEFVENGSIQHIAGIITEKLLINYAKQLTQALIILAQQQIYSGFLTIQNIYLTKGGKLKIQMLQYKPTQILSPEQANGAHFTTKTDVFQLGSLLYHLLQGEPASFINNKEELTQYFVPFKVSNKSQLVPLIEELLVKNPESRMNIQQIFMKFKWLGDQSDSIVINQNQIMNTINQKPNFLVTKELNLPGSEDEPETESFNFTNKSFVSQESQVKPVQKTLQIKLPQQQITQPDRDSFDIPIKTQIAKKKGPLISIASMDANVGDFDGELEGLEHFEKVKTIHRNNSTTFDQNDDDEDFNFMQQQKTKQPLVVKQKAVIKTDFLQKEDDKEDIIIQSQSNNTKYEFIAAWKEVFNGNLAPIGALETIFVENSQYFIQLFKMHQNVSNLVNLFSAHQVTKEFKKLITLINSMQELDLEFALKCQVVGYQTAFSLFLKEKTIAEHQTQTLKFIQIQTQHYMNSTEENVQKYEQQFDLFLANNGVIIIQMMLTVVGPRNAFLNQEEE
ncbi:Kinase [Hexamita inflata]|uniref:Kinase n=1 Tax=Hexamita inflata TaxID=28002 RepID=A0AA86UPN9_9EUKA|nr:Kinase [Hexamita inflata]CAI9959561.1 Kinase [Hexamita inflata]